MNNENQLIEVIYHGEDRDAVQAAFDLLQRRAESSGNWAAVHRLAEGAPLYYYALRNGSSVPDNGRESTALLLTAGYRSFTEGLSSAWAQNLVLALCLGLGGSPRAEGSQEAARAQHAAAIQNQLEGRGLATPDAVRIADVASAFNGGPVNHTLPLAYRVVKLSGVTSAARFVEISGRGAALQAEVVSAVAAWWAERLLALWEGTEGCEDRHAEFQGAVEGRFARTTSTEVVIAWMETTSRRIAGKLPGVSEAVVQG